MTQGALAQAAGVSSSTIKDFEAERRHPIANNIVAIEKVFTSSGLVFSVGAIAVHEQSSSR